MIFRIIFVLGFLLPELALAVGVFKVKSGEKELEFQLAAGKLLSKEAEREVFYAGEKLLLIAPDGAKVEVDGRKILSNAATHVVTLQQAKRGFLSLTVESSVEEYFGRIRLREPMVVFKSGSETLRLPLSQAMDPAQTKDIFKPGAGVEMSVEPPEAGPLKVNGAPVDPGSIFKPSGAGAPKIESPATEKNPADWLKMSPSEAKAMAETLRKNGKGAQCAGYIQDLESSARGEQEAWAQVRGPVSHQDSCSSTAQTMLPEVLGDRTQNDAGAKPSVPNANQKANTASPSASPSTSPAVPAAVGQ